MRYLNSDIPDWNNLTLFLNPDITAHLTELDLTQLFHFAWYLQMWKWGGGAAAGVAQVSIYLTFSSSLCTTLGLQEADKLKN